MSNEFDYYHQLLGIPPSEQPPNHYRLLGVTVFEAESSVINHAAARQMRYVREIASSNFAEISQQLLNELSTAKLCLLDPAKKQDYDNRLRDRLQQRQQQATEVERAITDLACLTNLPPDSVVAEQRTWLVGSGPDCDIIIDSETVSRRHCKILQAERSLHLQDLDSTNGTFLNRKPLRGKQELFPGDVITLGKTTLLPIPDGVRYSIPRESVVLIGRNKDNDIVLDHAAVSGRHARIVITPSGLVLEDLGSTNGTSLGLPQNRIVKSPVGRAQFVHFGEYRARIEDLVAGTAASSE